ncbi:MAG TPA: RluA family pseudouridine synthase [Phycisphaerae bacterium]|jgi:23S rRNA pseudouridine1911/1915/1917 synthase|nr:RluA family pseudouridine synthase [Phycisphaerae bacterium]
MDNAKNDAKQTVGDRLRAMYPEAKSTTLREMVAGKRVRVDGVAAKSFKQEVAAAQVVEVADRETMPTKRLTLAEGLVLVHADAHVLLIDKPSGLLTATDAQERRPTALKILTTYFQRQNHKNQVHLIHRLDRDASGLLLFGRSWEAFRSLKEQFYEHTITRRYDAIVHGIPKKPEARLEMLLLEDPETGVVRITKDMKKGKLAILDYAVVAADDRKNIAHVKCTLFTGRKHQIRVQMSAIGHPVLADPLYARGGKAPTPDEAPGRLALHASYLRFVHPTTRREATYESPMPRSFSQLFRT